MHRTIRAVLVATTLLQPVGAWAASPDAAGAKKVEEAFRTFGPSGLSKPGIVAVSPDGDGYQLALDLAKLIADAVAPMTVKEAAPLAFRLGPQANGTWTFDSSSPFKVVTEYLQANRSANLSVATETGTIKGLFDPAILSPREAEIGFTNGVASLRDSRDALKITVKDAKLSSTVKDVAEGRSDADGTFSVNDIAATHGTFPQPEIKISAAKLDGTYQVGKMDMAGFAAVVNFRNVTAGGKDVESLTAAERQALMALLAKHTPALDAAGMTLVASDVSSLEGGKGFRAEKIEYQTSWKGLSDKAVLSAGARVSNVTVDQGVWPVGLEAILPKEAALNFDASGFDMLAMWKDTNLLRSKTETEQLPRDHFSKLLFSDGYMTVDFANSFARSSFYDVSLSGQLKVAMNRQEKPVGKLSVTARDFDGSVKYLQDNIKTVPVFGRFAMMAAVAKGFGKPGPDGTLVWDVTFDKDGQISVNGQPLPTRR